jgi:hypothetical protein
VLIDQTDKLESREMITEYIRISMGVGELAAFVLIPLIAGIFIGRKIG